MDVLAVREATRAAIDKIRSNSSPYFIECKTFRFVGHSYADGQKYRDNDEIKSWRNKDPVETFPKYLINQNMSTDQEISDIKSKIDKQIDQAVKFAENSPNPPMSELYKDIYRD
jgi:TPP-dependent pyruvate/acetoin dehydrogenase alpha subunit